MKNYFLLLVSTWALCSLLENRAYAQNNVVPASGNVGIGTTNAIMPLTIQNNHVNGQVNEVLTLNDPINPRSFNITKYDRVINGFWNSDIRFNLNQVGVLNSTLLTLASSACVGIATTNPTERLEVQGNIKINSLSKSTPQYLLFNNRDINSGHEDTYHLGGMIASAWRDVADPSNVASIIFERKSAVRGLSSAGEIVFGTTMNGGNNIPQERMRIDYNGNVSIGTNNSFGYKLAVNGTIGAKEINLETTNFPDYVFDNNYPLPSLQEVEKYINAQHHLPNIPSAEEATQKGVSVGELQNKLLEKIEELTLYIIQQQKQMAQQQQRIEALENRK